MKILKTILKCHPMQQHSSPAFKHPPPSWWPVVLQYVSHTSLLLGHVVIWWQCRNSATPDTVNKMSLEMLSN